MPRRRHHGDGVVSGHDMRSVANRSTIQSPTGLSGCRDAAPNTPSVSHTGPFARRLPRAVHHEGWHGTERVECGLEGAYGPIPGFRPFVRHEVPDGQRERAHPCVLAGCHNDRARALLGYLAKVGEDRRQIGLRCGVERRPVHEEHAGVNARVVIVGEDLDEGVGVLAGGWDRLDGFL